MHSLHLAEFIEFNSGLIRRLGNHATDYRLYPGTDNFAETFDVQAYSDWLNHRGPGYLRRPLSLYIHLSYCHTLCWRCRSHPIIVHDTDITNTYLQYLIQEIRLQGKLLRNNLKVTHVYFSGETTTYLTDEQLHKIFVSVKQHFNLLPEGVFCIGINPRQFPRRSAQAMRDMGFNCAIVAVQDFDRQVQQSIHRTQSEEATLNTIQSLQKTGFQTIRIELSFGLPKQDLDKFTHTLNRIITAAPDQIKLLPYRHLPGKYSTQQHIDSTALPNTDIRLAMLLLAMSHLTEAHYTHIGMNLYAKTGDPLVQALRQGRLHYGLQGYSIFPDCDQVAFGVSGIGSIGPMLYQNYCDILQYHDKLKHNTLPIFRGLELKADDLIRRSVIYALICHSVISYESVEAFFPIDFKQYFAIELTELVMYEQTGLVKLDHDEITITPYGKLLINCICEVFDKYSRMRQQHKNHLSLL